MEHTRADHARVVAPPPILYAGTFLAGLYLDSWLPLRVFPRVLRSFTGGALLGVAVTTLTLATREMRRADTSIVPTQPTTAIVQSGPYQLTRNPIYGAFTLIYIGLSLLLNRPGPLMLLPLLLKAMRVGVIEREERYLEAKFGSEYTSYKARVPRWLQACK